MNRSGLQYSVIIPAAGIGSRMQAAVPKQYLKVGNKCVLEYTLERFISSPRINQIIIAINPSDTTIHKLQIANCSKITLVEGGAERVDSVKNALEFLANTCNQNEFVLVHDAARPCLRTQELDKLILECEQNDSKGISGAILAIPVADTIKKNRVASKSELSGCSTTLIDSTVDRSSLWQAQTPQMFKLQDLLKAINQSLNQGYQITDEASAMEQMGNKVALVEGDISNIKITRPSDLQLASFYLC